MKIWLYVDEFSTMDRTAEDEYEEIEEFFKGQLSGRLYFKREVLPGELKNGSPDIYLWDIGGMCIVDHSGDRRIEFCRQIVEQVDDHPNTLFIPYTAMTRRDLQFALTEYLPEFACKAEEDREYPEETPRGNVWCPKKEYEGGDRYPPSLVEKLKEWFK